MKIPSLVLLALFSILFQSQLASAQVCSSAGLDPIGSPATSPDPQCGSEAVSADAIMKVTGPAIDGAVGFPLAEGIKAISKQNWDELCVRWGLCQGGKARCATVCVVVSGNVSIDAVGCLVDGNKSESCHRADNEAHGIGYGHVTGFSSAVTPQGNRLLCATGNNHSNNRFRGFNFCATSLNRLVKPAELVGNWHCENSGPHPCNGSVQIYIGADQSFHLVNEGGNDQKAAFDPGWLHVSIPGWQNLYGKFNGALNRLEFANGTAWVR